MGDITFDSYYTQMPNFNNPEHRRRSAMSTQELDFWRETGRYTPTRVTAWGRDSYFYDVSMPSCDVNLGPGCRKLL